MCYVITIDRSIVAHRTVVDDTQPSKIIDDRTIDDRWSITTDRSIDRRSSTSDHPSSIINHQPSSITDHHRRPPIIAIAIDRAIIGHRSPPVIDHQPPTSISDIQVVGCVAGENGVTQRGLCWAQNPQLAPWDSSSSSAPDSSSGTQRGRARHLTQRVSIWSQHDMAAQPPYDRQCVARAWLASNKSHALSV